MTHVMTAHMKPKGSIYKRDEFPIQVVLAERALARWFQEFRNRSDGKYPTELEVEAQKDRLMLEIVTNYTGFDTTKRLYELSASEVRDAVLEARSKDPERYLRLMDGTAKRRGIDPDTRPVDFLRAFQDGTF